MEPKSQSDYRSQPGVSRPRPENPWYVPFYAAILKVMVEVWYALLGGPCQVHRWAFGYLGFCRCGGGITPGFYLLSLRGKSFLGATDRSAVFGKHK